MPKVTKRSRKKQIAAFAKWYIDSCEDMDAVLHLAEMRVLSWFDGLTEEQVQQEFAEYEWPPEEYYEV